MTRSVSDRRIAVNISEISFAIGDLALLMNSPENEHRTMKIASILDVLDTCSARMRVSLLRDQAPPEPTAPEVAV